MRFVILSVGRDPVLLKARRSALAGAGYAVESVTSLTSAIEKILEGDFDLILLCNSLGEEERLRLVSICRRSKPSTPILILSENGAVTYAAGTPVIPPLQIVVDAVAEALPRSVLSFS